MPSTDTPVSICNQALGWLGANLITSLDDEDSTEAKLCKANFASSLANVLEDAEWSFAVTRKRLVPLDDPNEDWFPSKAFQVPADTIRILQISPDGRFFKREFEWYLEDNKILVENMDVIWTRYIYNLTDVARCSPGFNHALAHHLAYELAAPLTENPETVAMRYQLLEEALDAATALDGLQGKNRRIRSRWMNEARKGLGKGGGSVG